MKIEEIILDDLEKEIEEAFTRVKQRMYKLQLVRNSKNKTIETNQQLKYILTYKGKKKMIKPNEAGLIETVKEYLTAEEGTVDIAYKILDSKRNLIFKNIL
jgi:hypothetical protein